MIYLIRKLNFPNQRNDKDKEKKQFSLVKNIQTSNEIKI